MVKFGIIFFGLFFYLFFPAIKPVAAAENPLAVANNKIGIHILDVSELPAAAQLVNSKGGDWGYIIIPIQAGDENLLKWQKFMDDCKKYHVIPIIRLATEGDYFNTQVWREPNQNDIVDAAIFLNSLDWPTKNQYVIVYNEVNRGDEWGGNANPTAYAQLLSFAVSVFKSESPNFFIISAGLDNAAPNQGSIYINEYTYIMAMNQAVPGIFNQLDGVSSHSYPNPGFSQAPNLNSMMGVGSFIHERDLIKSMSNKELPVFITETGWSANAVPENIRVQYYDQTFKTIWSDPNIVAVTPFLLQAGAGPFQQFSFINTNGSKTEQYQYLYNLSKVKGVPSFPTHQVLAASNSHTVEAGIVTKDFREYRSFHRSISLSLVMENVFNYLINR
ncbi:MAG TPA: hypothetical protein VNW29_01150 [Candidatus Sulfotelmatobacter sp.]|jgi:hypothetical protein|nr:hypothetical protein [Candidatus Sulfotelmatobacter sp.]